jgi:hypothetical protein
LTSVSLSGTFTTKKGENMIYLMYRLTAFTLRAIFWISVGCLAIAAIVLVATLVTFMVLGMFAGTIFEAAFAGLRELVSGRGLQRSGVAFSQAFSACATRYASWGRKGLKKAS